MRSPSLETVKSDKVKRSALIFNKHHTVKILEVIRVKSEKCCGYPLERLKMVKRSKKMSLYMFTVQLADIRRQIKYRSQSQSKIAMMIYLIIKGLSVVIFSSCLANLQHYHSCGNSCSSCISLLEALPLYNPVCPLSYSLTRSPSNDCNPLFTPITQQNSFTHNSYYILYQFIILLLQF